jgi:hypothetical protein
MHTGGVSIWLGMLHQLSWACFFGCKGRLSGARCNLKGPHSLALLVSYPFLLQQAPLSIPMQQKAGPQQLREHTAKWRPLPKAYNRLSAIISHYVALIVILPPLISLAGLGQFSYIPKY